jgi:hypothetical protein
MRNYHLIYGMLRFAKVLLFIVTQENYSIMPYNQSLLGHLHFKLKMLLWLCFVEKQQAKMEMFVFHPNLISHFAISSFAIQFLSVET